MPSTLHRLAATDPATPATVLAALAATPDPSQVTSAWLLAHPNTPLEHLEGVTLDTDAYLGFALNSPALTDATRTRVLERTATHALHSHLSSTWPPDRQAVAVLSARLLSGSLTGDDLAGTAALLMDHAWVPPQTRLAALQVAVTVDGSAWRGSHYMALVATAATAFPEHAADLLDRTRVSFLWLREQLRQLSDQHRAGQDPRALLIERALSAMEAYANETSALRAVGTTPLAQVAAFAIETCPTPTLAHEIVRQPALLGTRVWSRAWVLYASGSLPAAGVELPVDTDELDARYASNWQTASGTSSQPLTVGPAALERAAQVLDRLAADTTGYDAEHTARLLLHPATPAHLHPMLRAHLTRILHTVGPDYFDASQAPALVSHLPDGPGLADALADVPLESLSIAGQDDDTVSDAIAFHLRDLARPLWADPHATRAAFALAPTFAGTMRELVTTVTAVAATPGP